MFEILQMSISIEGLQDGLTSSCKIKEYFKKKKESLLKDIQEVEGKCNKICTKIQIPVLIKSKKFVFDTVRIYCSKFRAQLYYHVGDYVSALRFVRKAFDRIHGSCYMINKSLPTDGLKLSNEGSSQNSFLPKTTSSTSTTSEIDATYSSNLI